MKKWNRLFAFLLVGVLALSCFPKQVLAAQGDSAAIIYDGEAYSFQVEGEYSLEDGYYISESEISYLIDQGGDYFNRYTLFYSSDIPMKGTVTYLLSRDGSDEEYSEEFFLEAGADKQFSSLIDGYLDDAVSPYITKLSFEPIEKKTASFQLTEIDTEQWDSFETIAGNIAGVTSEPDGTIYLENEKYKLGVFLTWGGGISYLEDKVDGDEQITNLLNRADPGRLVQQSYYGTQTFPYSTAGSFHSEWAYNPVQGGDQHGNHSKIVDFKIDSDSMYVKARPQDWAKNNELTLSYMEATYTLTEEYVKVDNRFVDFSDYYAPARDQELPAFYTISNLGDFVYYGGEEPWTGDELTRVKDLPFWGTEETVAQCTFYSNLQEPWCAWVQEDSDYGVGLFVPNVNMLRAGRNMFNGSKDPLDGGTNYVAPLKVMQMQSFTPIEYSYLFCAGELSEIRDVFTDNKDFNDNASLNYETKTIDLTKFFFAENSSYVLFHTDASKINQTNIFEANDGLTFEVTDVSAGADPYVTMEWKYTLTSLLQAEEYPYVVLTSMAPSRRNTYDEYTTELFLLTGDVVNAQGGRSVSYTLPADDRYHSEIIDLSENPYWYGNLNGFRLDYFAAAEQGDRYHLYSLQLAKTKEEAALLAQKAEDDANHVCRHESGDWQTDEQSHWKICTLCGEQIDLDAHSGGMATCKSKAACEICGVSYGTLDANRHTGLTEVRDQKSATETAAGYTGDTYCLDCGAKLAAGKVIPALGQEEVPTAPESSTTVPQTGESGNLMWTALLWTAAGALLFGIAFNRRRFIRRT